MTREEKEAYMQQDFQSMVIDAVGAMPNTIDVADKWWDKTITLLGNYITKYKENSMRLYARYIADYWATEQEDLYKAMKNEEE